MILGLLKKTSWALVCYLYWALCYNTAANTTFPFCLVGSGSDEICGALDSIGPQFHAQRTQPGDFYRQERQGSPLGLRRQPLQAGQGCHASGERCAARQFRALRRCKWNLLKLLSDMGKNMFFL